MNEHQEAGLIWKALHNLYDENRIWSKNIAVFVDMSHPIRMQWWKRVQQQAKAGVPAMQALVTEVIKLRLKG